MAPAEKQASPGASREQLAVLPHLVRVLYEALFWSPLDNLRGIVGRLRDLETHGVGAHVDGSEERHVPASIAMTPRGETRFDSIAGG